MASCTVRFLSIWSLYSLKNDSVRSLVQSLGVGAMEKNVSACGSSGPGLSQYATATPRWNSGITITFTGSLGTVTSFLSRTNLVASASAALALSTMSLLLGWLFAM